MKEKKETPIQQIVNHYFSTLDLDLEDIKEACKSGEIKYSRHVKSAKDLLELTDGNIEKAKEAIDKVANWANNLGYEYTIETVFKKWLELNNL